MQLHSELSKIKSTEKLTRRQLINIFLIALRICTIYDVDLAFI